MIHGAQRVQRQRRRIAQRADLHSHSYRLSGGCSNWNKEAAEEGGRATDTGRRDTHTIVSPNDNRSHPGGNATHHAGHSPSRPPTEAEKEPNARGVCGSAAS